ncbi:MAG TPA: hypothetical protein VHM90_14325, partial [Phycisphaerae bacterium]|nr:hypothetical protein [Phycisphaerae bacterium]
EAPAHFTCHFDQLPDGVKIDQILRLTGTVGPVVAASERVELLNCREAVVVGDPTVGNRLAGNWRANALILDGVALRKEAQQQGKKVDDIPATQFASNLRLELAIKADGTFASELRDGETLVRKAAGRWVVTKDAADSAKVRLEAPGVPGLESTARFDGDRLKMALPGYADRHIVADSAFEKVTAVPQNMDWKGMKNQTIGWFTANTSLQQQPAQQILTAITGVMDANFNNHNWFVASVGSALLKRGKTTVLVAGFNKLTVLELNDAQTQHDNARKLSSNYGEIPAGGVLVTPEVKIENFTLDKKGPIDPTQPITGKITVHALRRTLPGQFGLLLQMQGSAVVSAFSKPVGADSETFSFQFEAIGNRLPPNISATIPLIFVVARQAPRPTSPSDNSLVSEPLISLVDIAWK